MAKNNGRGKLLIGILAVSLTALAMIVTGVLAYSDTSNKAVANTGEISELKEDGCDPGKEARGDVKVINFRLDSIDEKQKEFSVEQRQMRKENETAFKEILKRLPK